MNTQTISEPDLYNVQSNKTNGDILNAGEWNSLSNAVSTSHERINSLVGDLGELNGIKTAIDTKASKASNPVQGNLVQHDGLGNLVDSGKSISDLYTKSEGTALQISITEGLATKQNIIDDINTIRANAALGATAKQPATTLAGYGITDAYTKSLIDDSILNINTSLSGKLDTIPANTYDAYGEASTTKSEVIGDAASDYNTLGKLEDKIQDEASARENADTVLDGRVNSLEDAVGSGGSIDERIANAVEGTVWSKPQVLSDSLKSTVKNNLGLTQDLLEMRSEIDALNAAVAQLDGHALVVVDTLPTDASPAETPDPDVIYRKYVDDGQGNVSYEDYMYNADDLTTPIKIATYDLPGLDDEPTPGSDNLVKSGGVYKELYGDSEYQAVALDLVTDAFYGNYNSGETMRNHTSAKTGTSCAVITASEGDKFKIYGRGTSNILLYAFTDSDDNILLANSGTIDTRTDGLEITAPSGATKLYINFFNYDSSTDKLEKKLIVSLGIVQMVEELEDAVDTLDEQVQQKVAKSDIVDNLNTDDATKTLSAKQGKVLNTAIQTIDVEINGERSYAPVTLTLTSDNYKGINTTQNTISSTLTPRTGTSCADLDVVTGDKFKIFGKGTKSICLYIFADSNRNILSRNTEVVNSSDGGLEITAPSGATKLYINFFNYDSSTDKLQKYTIIEEGLKDDISNLENRVNNIEEQISDINEEISDINEEIDGEYSVESLATDIVEHTYFNMGGIAIGNRLSIGSHSFDCASLEVECVEGDRFILHGIGRTEFIRLYSFVDASRKIIERAEYPLDTRAEGITITAPRDATKLFVNFLDFDSSVDSAEKYVLVNSGILPRIKALEVKEESTVNVLKDKVFIAFGDSITEFKWSIASGGDGKGWVDHAEEILDCKIINCAIGGSHMNTVYNTELFDETHEYAVDSFVFRKPVDTMNLYKCVVAHTGPWDDNDFIDVSETNYIANAAYGPIMVYSMIHAFCNTSIVDPVERFKNQAAAAECIYTWKPSHDDNRAIIERLINTDPNNIDGVIIAEGTNDYNTPTRRGVSGSFDVNTCLGATNQALLELCSTFKKFAVYYVTPPVKWWNWTGADTSDIADFSDYYKVGGSEDITLREWVEILKNEYQLRHIPVCDLYNELGWNQWNFANYFPETGDGTHPRQGFKNIGAKVASFLIAHNVIK